MSLWRITFALVLLNLTLEGYLTLEQGKTYTIHWVPPVRGFNETSLALAVRGQNEVVLEEFDYHEPTQRFIARKNEDNTFNFFLEKQPWNWIDHIVERTKTVNIERAPKILEGVGALTNTVLHSDYDGSKAQKWYLVPNGDDENTGMLNNVLVKMCIVGNGVSASVSLSTCSFSDAFQQFRITEAIQT